MRVKNVGCAASYYCRRDVHRSSKASVFGEHLGNEMKSFVPANVTRPTMLNVSKPQAQQGGQALKTVSSPVAWVRRFSIEDRLRVNNVRLMPGTSLCSVGTTFKTLHAMELVKKIILQHLQKCSTVACCLGFMAAALAVVDVEMTHRHRRQEGNDKYRERLSSDGFYTLNASEIAAVVAKSIISFLTLLMCINIYLTYASICKFNIARNLLPDSATVFNSNLFVYYMLETLLCLFHVPPLMDRYLDISYKLQLLVLMRVYVIARYMKEHNKFTRNKTCLFLASVTRTELSNMFLFKTCLKKMPFKVIVTTYLLNIFLGAYVIYVIEEKDTYLDTTWMVIVTMTTLGYGDVVPASLLGRLIAGLMSVLGIFLMALLISVIHETLQLSQNEKRILAHLENADHNSNKKIAAARLIQSSWRFYHYIKVNRESLAWKRIRQIARLKKLKNNLFANLHNWRQHKRINADHWYKEFISDDIAMMVTDVGRAVDKIQFTLNRVGYTNVQGRRGLLKKEPLKKGIIYEELEECPRSKRANVTNAKSDLNMKLSATSDSYRSRSASAGALLPERRVLDEKLPVSSLVSPSLSRNESMRNDLTRSHGEQSRKEIEQKLESMEDYLDGFYTKAKSDLRDIMKLCRDEFLSAERSSNPAKPVVSIALDEN